MAPSWSVTVTVQIKKSEFIGENMKLRGLLFLSLSIMDYKDASEPQSWA